MASPLTPPPPLRDYSLQEWGILLGIITTVVAAIYGLWRKAIRPFLIWSHRMFSEASLRAELDDIKHHKHSVQVLGRQMAEVVIRLDALETACQPIPILHERVAAMHSAQERIEAALENVNQSLVELASRRRRYDRD